MKKYFVIALLAVVALTTSCKGWLTEEPVMSQSTELTLSDYNGLNKAVGGAYTPLCDGTWYGAFFVLDAEMRAGNARIPGNTEFTSGRMMVPYYMTYEPSSTSGLWTYAYYLISCANNVLDVIEKQINNLTSSSVTEQDINNLKAEALALRALAHFDLLRLYGRTDGSNGEFGVCLITTPQLPTDMPARATVAQTFESIISDLTTAESLMAPGYVRAGVADAKATITPNVIKALLARVYLYNKNWQKAADYATAIINSNEYTLWTADEYTSVWGKDVAGKGGEVIFEVYGKQANAYDEYWEGPSHMTNPLGYADCAASEALTSLFEAGDVRGTAGVRGKDDGNVMFATDKDQVSKTLWTMKYMGKGEGNATSTPDVNNVIVLRLSEMYLIRAEAILNGASVAGTTALADINAIRANRNATPLTSASKQDVAKERILELNFEGHLWFDLDRTGSSLSYADGSVTRELDANSKFWALPIPKSQIDLNENLKQNPGYGE